MKEKPTEEANAYMLEALLKTMTTLIDLHESLLSVSEEKTTRLKENNINGFNDLLKIEQKHVQALEQVEKQRLKEASNLAARLGLAENAPVTTIIDSLPEASDKEALEEKATTLLAHVVDIKQQEDLNRQLLKQSLQFVQLQMDILQPTVESLTYGNKSAKEDPATKRSVFDSKA
jgi:flagellar biosynthesis/type III secretory pathway chaperone